MNTTNNKNCRCLFCLFNEPKYIFSEYLQKEINKLKQHKSYNKDLFTMIDKEKLETPDLLNLINDKSNKKI